MALPQTVTRLLKQIEDECGLIGILTLVGPRPIRGGDLRVLS
jgi:hypothetical protein